MNRKSMLFVMASLLPFALLVVGFMVLPLIAMIHDSFLSETA
ncbi:hypothetical protein [Paenibacillus sp. DMB20]|nr:hypothetical protein [Paenibacillus sp. DMB20]